MKAIILLITLFGVFTLSAQFGNSKIKGTVYDETTGEPIPFCNVYLYQNGKFLNKGTTADVEGNFELVQLRIGEYEVGFSDIDHPEKKLQIQLSSDEVKMLYPKLGGNEIGEVTFVVHPNLIKPDQPTQQIIDAKTIEKSPTRNMGIARMAADVTPGVQHDERTGAVYFRGARDGTTQYVIDGIKMTEPGIIPAASIAEIKVMSSGIPAEFGDVTGGIVYITTKSYR